MLKDVLKNLNDNFFWGLHYNWCSRIHMTIMKPISTISSLKHLLPSLTFIPSHTTLPYYRPSLVPLTNSSPAFIPSMSIFLHTHTISLTILVLPFPVHTTHHPCPRKDTTRHNLLCSVAALHLNPRDIRSQKKQLDLNHTHADKYH